jgi:hypothetical protein
MATFKTAATISTARDSGIGWVKSKSIASSQTQTAPARKRAGAGVLKKPPTDGRNAFSLATWT